ncbi:MAG: cysteine hydrolase [Sulfobacillus thermotolerans]|uniref:Isochorismatase-like domain-containing protein n=1 Tax=Sulfobacillus thermotolerans TaxID=338644 RepID=A0ABM6RP87_9FIRM|nr:hypothetical protein BXT84_03400 [Sulfobacillus thermotolerans]MCY0908259.1 cysteine hydrolase [Sulfobacillus thermotolerans]
MRIGHPNNWWEVSGDTIDISRAAPPRHQILHSQGSLIFSPAHSALLIIDMQNYFCAAELKRAPTSGLIPAIQQAVDAARSIGMHIGWVNWGNRLDLANLPPSVLYAFQRNSEWGGIGGSLPQDLGPALVKDSWSVQLVPGLIPEAADWRIDKYRLSGFQGTVLDQILRSHQITTLFFAGVNVDQCVFATLLDGAALGYDTILLSDCAATTSPAFAEQATHYNIARSGGFLTTSTDLHATRVLPH